MKTFKVMLKQFFIESKIINFDIADKDITGQVNYLKNIYNQVVAFLCQLIKNYHQENEKFPKISAIYYFGVNKPDENFGQLEF